MNVHVPIFVDRLKVFSGILEVLLRSYSFIYPSMTLHVYVLTLYLQEKCVCVGQFVSTREVSVCISKGSQCVCEC